MRVAATTDLPILAGRPSPWLALLGALLASAATLAITVAVGASSAATGFGIERPLLGAVLFTTPALIGLAGAWRREPSLLVAAGILCLLHSVLSFSGATILYLPAALAFFAASSQGDAGRRRTGARWTPLGALAVIVVAPALAVLTIRFMGVLGVLVLVAIGGLAPLVARSRAGRVQLSAGSAVVGILVVGLVLGGWVVANGSTREVCWVERQGAGGVVRQTIPAGEERPFVVGGDVVATGCDSGIPTTQGVLLALGLAGLAIGAAVLAPTSPRRGAAPAT